jgi:hypothetical protein
MCSFNDITSSSAYMASIMNWKGCGSKQSSDIIASFPTATEENHENRRAAVLGAETLSCVFRNRKEACQPPGRGVRILTEYKCDNRVPKVQSECAPQCNMADCCLWTRDLSLAALSSHPPRGVDKAETCAGSADLPPPRNYFIFLEGAVRQAAEGTGQGRRDNAKP